MAEYEQLEAWLTSRGFVVTQGSANRLSVSARGTRAQAERAFDTPIVDFRAGRRAVYSNLEAPALPGTIAAHVQAVMGMSDVAPPRAPQSDWLKAHPCIAEAIGIFAAERRPRAALSLGLLLPAGVP